MKVPRLSGRVENIGGYTASINGRELAGDGRVIASPVGSKQDVVSGAQSAFYLGIVEHRVLIDLAGKAPCSGEVDENRTPL